MVKPYMELFMTLPGGIQEVQPQSQAPQGKRPSGVEDGHIISLNNEDCANLQLGKHTKIYSANKTVGPANSTMTPPKDMGLFHPQEGRNKSLSNTSDPNQALPLLG